MSDPIREKKSVILPETTIINYDFERMLKSFIKQVEKDGIIQEIRERRYYIKPSAKRRTELKKRRK